MMRREGGRVVIEISSDEFHSLLLCLGYATGAASRRFGGDVPSRDRMLADSWFRLANSINEGNPHWTPYGVPEEKVPVQSPLAKK